MKGGNLIDFKKVKFVHLRNYSQYSLSKGALRINELVDFCKAESIPAAAISMPIIYLVVLNSVWNVQNLVFNQ